MSTADRPWLAQYAPGVPAEIEVTDESLADLLENSVTRFADLVALDFYGAATTYRDLGDQVARMAERAASASASPRATGSRS